MYNVRANCVGSLGHSCFDARAMLVGASGGGYALIGAHLANLFRVRTTQSTHYWQPLVLTVYSTYYILYALCTETLHAVSSCMVASVNRQESACVWVSFVRLEIRDILVESSRVEEIR